MAEIAHLYVEDNSLKTDTDGNYTNGVQINSSNIVANTKYLVIARCLIGSASPTTKVTVRVDNPDDTAFQTKSTAIYEMNQTGSTSLKSYFFVHSYTSDSSPGSLTLHFKSDSASSDAYMDQMSMLAIDLGEIGIYGLLDGGGASNNADGRVFGATGTNEASAIRFTPGSSGDLGWLEAEMWKQGTPTDNWTVTIRTTSATGTVVGTSDSMAASALTTSLSKVKTTFTTPVALTGGTEYWAVFERSGSRDVSNYISVFSRATDNGGELMQNASSGSWSNTTRYAFTRWGTEGGYYEDIVAATGTEITTNANTRTVMASIDSADLGTTEEWLVIASSKIGIGSTGRFFSHVLEGANDGTALANMGRNIEEGEDTAEERMTTLFARYKATGGSVDAAMTAYEEANNGNMTAEGAYMIALPFSFFADVEQDFTLSTQSASTESTIATVASYTPSAYGDHLIFGSTRNTVNDGRDYLLFLEDGTVETRTGDSTPTHDQKWDVSKDSEVGYTMQVIDIASGTETYNLRANLGTGSTVENSWLFVVNLNAASTGPTDYDETGKTVAIVATVTQVDVYTPAPTDYDETGRTVGIVATVTQTDVYTDVTEYDETGRAVTVVATVTEVDSQAFDEVGATVSVTATVTQTDVHTRHFVETGRAVTVTATVTQVDQADFKESLSVAGVATVTQVDTFTPSPASSTQLGYRLRDDSVALNADAGWLAPLNTPYNYPIDNGTQFRIRVLIGNTGSTAFPATEDWIMEARVNAGAWTAINLLGVYTTSSGQYAGGDPTTQLIGSGTFEAGAGIEGSTDALNYDLAGGAETEFEWVFSIPDFGEVFTGDVIEFRVVDAVGTPLDVIDETPSMTMRWAYVEQRSIGGIVATVTITDAKGMTESVTVPVIGTVTAVESQGCSESLTVPIVATVTESHVYTPGSTDYDETGRTVTIVGTVSLTDSKGYDESTAVTVVATVTETDQADFDETGVTVAIVATVTQSDSKGYDETGLSVAAVGTVTETDRADFKEAPSVIFTAIVSAVSSTDQADFDETGRTVAIVGTVTETDTRMHSETGLTVAGIATVTEVDQADFVESATVAIVATVTQVDVFTPNLGVSYDETGRTVAAVATVTEVDQFDADEAGATVTVLATVTEVDQADFKEAPTVLFAVIVSAVSSTDEAAFDETGRSVEIVGTVAQIDQADFDETGRTVAIVSTVTSTDSKGYTESVSVNVVATVTELDDAAFFESVTVPIVATVTETDVFTPNLGTNYDETGRTVSIVATVTEVDQADFKESPAVLFTAIVSAVSSTDQADFDETGRAVAGVVTVSGTASSGYTESVSVAVVATVTASEQYGMSEPSTVAVTATVTETDQADFNESLTVAIVATVTETDVHAGAPSDYDETGRTVAIVATVTAVESGGYNEASAYSKTSIVKSLWTITKEGYGSIDPISMLIDDNYGTFYSTHPWGIDWQGAVHDFRIDMGSADNIARWFWTQPNNGSHPHTIDIYSSDDGIGWSLRKQYTSLTFDAPMNGEMFFAPVSAQHWRIVERGTNGNGAVGWRINEFDLEVIAQQLTVPIIATINSTDQADYVEALSVPIVGTVTQNDTYTPRVTEDFDETGLLVEVVATVTQVEQYGIVEAGIVTGNATITEGDTLLMTEVRSVSTIATVTQSDDWWSYVPSPGRGLGQTVDITPRGSTITIAGVGETTDPTALGTTGA